MAEESLIDDLEVAVAAAWKRATGKGPPEWSTAFAAACWRVAVWLESFDPPYEVTDIAVVHHARTWRAARDDWETPPILLCDFAAGRKRYLFWLVLREEAAKHGGSL